MIPRKNARYIVKNRHFWCEVAHELNCAMSVTQKHCDLTHAVTFLTLISSICSLAVSIFILSFSFFLPLVPVSFCNDLMAAAFTTYLLPAMGGLLVSTRRIDVVFEVS